MIFSISASCPSEYPIAGSTGPTSYLRKVWSIVPIAHGRGSTTSRAPCARAATTPAPNFISPWVRVGPSSITRTRLPAITSASSTVTLLFAFTTVASGLARWIVSINWFTCSIEAESILLITMTSAIRRLASPG
jgi:hypothetical protein